MTCFLNFDELALGLSVHAHKRAAQRGVKQKMVAHLLRFGRKRYQNGAVYYSAGRKEIAKHQQVCPELKQMNGYHMVMSTTGEILTVFRNQDFKMIRHC